jgi:hypothetical protein
MRSTTARFRPLASAPNPADSIGPGLMLVAGGVRFATSARSPNPCPTTSLKPRQTCQRICGANRQASDHELAEPLSVGVAGGFGILLKPFRCSADSSFIAFSTDRSIPRSSKRQAATTTAQSRTKRPRAVAVALRPITTGGPPRVEGAGDSAPGFWSDARHGSTYRHRTRP